MRNTKDELSSIIGGRNPYEPDPDQITQSDIFGATGQVAKQYAMEPINLVDRFSRYLEGERSGHLIKVGNQWIDREAWDLSQQIGGELMGGWDVHGSSSSLTTRQHRSFCWPQRDGTTHRRDSGQSG